MVPIPTFPALFHIPVAPPKDTSPVAVKFPVAREVEVASPSDEVAVIVSEVKVGLDEKLSVEVEVNVRLGEVEVKYESGDEKKEFQLEEEAVSGME